MWNMARLAKVVSLLQSEQRFNSCAWSLLFSSSHRHNERLCLGGGLCLRAFSGTVTNLKWCPLSVPSWAPPARWLSLCLVAVVTLKTVSLSLPQVHFIWWPGGFCTCTLTHLHLFVDTWPPPCRQETHKRCVCQFQKCVNVIWSMLLC